MAYVVHFFGTGIAFFVGIGAILLALAIFTLLRTERWKSCGSLLATIGLTLVAVSATPLPYALYAVAAPASIAWLVAERGGPVRARPWLRGLVAGLCLIAFGSRRR